MTLAQSEYEKQAEALFDAAATQPSRFKVLSAAEFASGPLTADPYYTAVARKDWKAVNAMNDARAKGLIAEWSQENDLNNVSPIKPEAPKVEAPKVEAPKPETPKAEPLSRHIGDILAHPTTVRWLKRDEIERGVIAVLAGPRGSYKTAAKRRWGMHVAAVLGEPWLDFNGEGSGTDRQIAGEIKAHYPHIDPKTLPIYIVNKRLDLGSAAGRQAVFNEMTRIKDIHGKAPGFCSIDTFSKFRGSLQEKDNAEVSAYLNGIDAAIRRPFDCTCLIITHTGIADQTRARGASALEADTDAAYISSRNGDFVYVSRERFKDSPELDPLTFKAQIVNLGYKDPDGIAVTTVTLENTKECPKYQPKVQRPSGENQTAILEILKTSTDIETAIDAALDKRGFDSTTEKRRDARKALEKLADKRLIWIDGERCGPGALKPASTGNDPFEGE